MLSKESSRIISLAFGPDIEKRNKFASNLSNFTAGRHILDLCPAYIYDLDGNVIARRNALNYLFPFKSTELIFTEMQPKHIYALSDIAKESIEKGISLTLNQLDLKSYITTAKIIKAGAAIKKHHADQTFGGRTIRNYLTYICTTNEEEKSEPENIKICKAIIVNKKDEINSVNIKSLPFSLINYNNRIIVNKGELVSPDIEAKSNLRKILGDQKYAEARIKEISIRDATYCEDFLIKQIKKLVQSELTNIYNESVEKIDEDFMKKKLEIASDLKILGTITTKGQIKDIIEYFKQNINTIIYAQKNPLEILSKEKTDCIFKIEYCSMQVQIENPREYSEWLTEFGAAKEGKFVTFSKLIPIMKHRCSPYIDGSPITDYDFNIPISLMDSLIFEYKNSKDKDKCARKILEAINAKEGDTNEA